VQWQEPKWTWNWKSRYSFSKGFCVFLKGNWIFRGIGSGRGFFEKFHRVDEALTAERSGTGLGLSIARQLARGLGGELRYAPRAGGGAEFIVELP